MLTQHPTLLIGPSDWDAERMPKSEFDRRIATLWDAFPDAHQAIVFGSAMQPLTFIADMAPLNTLGKAVAGWKPLLIGGGHMTGAFRKTIDDATGGTTQDASAHVLAGMRRKSPAELSAIREACTVLQTTVAAIAKAAHGGAGVTTAVLAGERAAIDAGAQDVRTLFSLDGGRTLRPFEALDDRRTDPLQVYVAARRFNYWAEGFACMSQGPEPAASLATLRLDNALSAIRPGVPLAQLSKILAVGAPYRMHPVTEGAHANAIGLALDGPVDALFEAGEVYTVRAGLTDGAAANAIVSAMVAVGDGGNDVLWRSGIA